jgi:hypothetical protein
MVYESSIVSSHQVNFNRYGNDSPNYKKEHIYDSSKRHREGSFSPTRKGPGPSILKQVDISRSLKDSPSRVGLSNAVKPSDIKINKDGKFLDTLLSPSPLNSNPFSIKRGEPNSAIDTLHMQNNGD